MKLEDKLLDRVDLVSEKVNSISTHAWDALVRLELIKGIVALSIATIGSLMLLFVGLYILNKYIRTNKSYESNTVFYWDYSDGVKVKDGFGEVLVNSYIFFIIIGLIMLPLFFYLGLTRVFVPEVYAVRDIIEMFKK